MLLLSQLKRFQVVDAHGRSAVLLDVAADAQGDGHPAIHYLLCRTPPHAGGILPWQAVTGLDRLARRVGVDDLTRAERPPANGAPDKLGHACVWLSRDVLDALLLDLRGHRATIANNLLLSGDAAGLRLRAAAVGPRAIVQRLSGGRFARLKRADLLDWKHVQFLRGDPAQARRPAPQRLARLPAGLIAHLTEALPYPHAAELIQMLAAPEAADVLEDLSLERRVQIFEELDETHALAVLANLAPDSAADVLGALGAELARQWLDRLPRPSADRLIELLRYPPHTVGGAMTNDVVWVPLNLTVGQARQALREQIKAPDFVLFIYVVDDAEQRRLRGVLTLRALLAAPEATRLQDVMNPYLLQLAPLDDARQAAFRVLESELAALPVVDRAGRLLGLLTVDAAVALAAPRHWTSVAPKVFT